MGLVGGEIGTNGPEISGFYFKQDAGGGGGKGSGRPDLSDLQAKMDELTNQHGGTVEIPGKADPVWKDVAEGTEEKVDDGSGTKQTHTSRLIGG